MYSYVERRHLVTIPWQVEDSGGAGGHLLRSRMSDAVDTAIAELARTTNGTLAIPVTVEAMTSDVYGVHLLLSVWNVRGDEPDAASAKPPRRRRGRGAGTAPTSAS